jgi:hypothetical protein
MSMFVPFFPEQAKEKSNKVSHFFLLQDLSESRYSFYSFVNNKMQNAKCFSTDTTLMHVILPNKNVYQLSPNRLSYRVSFLTQ